VLLFTIEREQSCHTIVLFIFACVNLSVKMNTSTLLFFISKYDIIYYRLMLHVAISVIKSINSFQPMFMLHVFACANRVPEYRLRIYFFKFHYVLIILIFHFPYLSSF